jgi:hypothetical protein
MAEKTILAAHVQRDRKIIGEKLPASAEQYRPWWGNEVNAESRQCHAWLNAGWQVESVDLKAKRVVFKKM